MVIRIYSLNLSESDYVIELFLQSILLEEFMWDLFFGSFLILAIIIAIRKGWFKSALEILFGPLQRWPIEGRTESPLKFRFRFNGHSDNPFRTIENRLLL